MWDCPVLISDCRAGKSWADSSIQTILIGGFILTTILAEMTHFSDPGTITKANLAPAVADLKEESEFVRICPTCEVFLRLPC